MASVLNTPGDDAQDDELDLDFGRLEHAPGPDPDAETTDVPPRDPAGGADCRPLDDEREQVGYELFSWDAEELDALDEAMHRLGLSHEWESDGYELVVHATDEETVDALLPTIRVRDSEADDDEDDDATDVSVLTELFVTVSKLRKDPTGSGVPGFLDAAESIGAAPPYGVDDRAWDRVTDAVDALIDGYHADAPTDVLRNLVEAVHRYVRPLV